MPWLYKNAAVVDALGYLYCVEHESHASGLAQPMYADNAAMKNEVCDAPGCGARFVNRRWMRGDVVVLDLSAPAYNGG